MVRVNVVRSTNVKAQQPIVIRSKNLVLSIGDKPQVIQLNEKHMHSTVKMLLQTGHIFKVVFKKRSNGEERAMICRGGVRPKPRKTSSKRKHRKGLGYDPDKKKLAIVYDMQVHNYRAIPTDSIVYVKYGSTVFVPPTE